MSKTEERQQSIAPSDGAARGSNGASAAPGSKTDGNIAEIRLRIPLNVVVPIGALIAIMITVALFGFFLLSLPKEHAPAVALAMALNIMAAATFAASRRELGARTIAELAILIVYPILLAVLLVNLGFGEVEEATATTSEAAAGAEAAEAAPVSLGAENMEFTTDELEVPADQEVQLEFDNPDAAPHNVAIYEDDSLENDLFVGETVEPGGSITYELPPLAAGAYYFRCDIHPAMEGRVTAN